MRPDHLPQRPGNGLGDHGVPLILNPVNQAQGEVGRTKALVAPVQPRGGHQRQPAAPHILVGNQVPKVIQPGLGVGQQPGTQRAHPQAVGHLPIVQALTPPLKVCPGQLGDPAFVVLEQIQSQHLFLAGFAVPQCFDQGHQILAGHRLVGPLPKARHLPKLGHPHAIHLEARGDGHGHSRLVPGVNVLLNLVQQFLPFGFYVHHDTPMGVMRKT